LKKERRSRAAQRVGCTVADRRRDERCMRLAKEGISLIRESTINIT
jgi:hypothetical protein